MLVESITAAHILASMEKVIAEIDRVLKSGGHMALYVSDSWQTRGGTPGERHVHGGVASNSLRLSKRFEPVVSSPWCVTTKACSRQLAQGGPRPENFFLRGFNYLFIMRKA